MNTHAGVGTDKEKRKSHNQVFSSPLDKDKAWLHPDRLVVTLPHSCALHCLSVLSSVFIKDVAYEHSDKSFETELTIF